MFSGEKNWRMENHTHHPTPWDIHPANLPCQTTKVRPPTGRRTILWLYFETPHNANKVPEIFSVSTMQKTRIIQNVVQFKGRNTREKKIELIERRVQGLFGVLSSQLLMVTKEVCFTLQTKVGRLSNPVDENSDTSNVKSSAEATSPKPSKEPELTIPIYSPKGKATKLILSLLVLCPYENRIESLGTAWSLHTHWSIFWLLPKLQMSVR